MGFFDDLKNQASDMLGGASDIGSNVSTDLSGLSTDMQEQITQYAEDHNVSIDAAKEHFLGGGGGSDS